MNRRALLIGGGAATLAGGLFYLAGCTPAPTAKVKPIRLGWQPPWSNQGQLVEILKTDTAVDKPVLELSPFNFGGPMTEAASAGRLDVLFLGDQPGLKLISKHPGWRIVSKLVNYRSAFVAPPRSTIRALADLKGKTIGTAFGSTTHRDAVRTLSQAGIDPEKDVKFVNIDQAEHSAVIAAGAGKAKWGEIDAIATYDPTIAVAEAKGLARVVLQWASLGVVVANAEMLGQRKAQLEGLLRALRGAYPIYAASAQKYDDLYIQDAHISLSRDLLHAQTTIDPNFSARDVSSVRQSLSGKDLETMRANVAAAISLKLLPEAFRFEGAVDDSIVKRIEAGG